MSPALPRPNRQRRGVTLVEMLVVVALVILMMTILVQIFANATGAMTASKASQELDVLLRSVDLRMKQDLLGVTAKMTPPNDPSLKQGYFEYGENGYADLQGEDSDDYLAFTTKAPEGQVFTGRAYIPNVGGSASNTAIQPVTITSQLAEVVYFLRNGNLYRRVFLIVPQRQGVIGGGLNNPFPALAPTAVVGFMGVNDISLHPSPVGPNNGLAGPIPNDLGDLTNRENRAFRPRLRTDFLPVLNGGFSPDGVDDDANGDDIPDFYPTLYPNLFSTSTNPHLVNEVYLSGSATRALSTSYDVLPFPYIYPGMFTQANTTYLAYGSFHSLDPSGNTYNHNPLFSGDNLPTPTVTQAGTTQTWFGFPTWRETLSNTWLDPYIGLNYFTSPPQQQAGLRPIHGNINPGSLAYTAGYTNNFLPPVTNQYANDGIGSGQFASFCNPDSNASNYSSLAPTNAQGVWDDDLVLTNVRSFDVKAYDPFAPNYGTGASAGYYDLGWIGDPTLAVSTNLWDDTNQPVGFGHMGRIPPMARDNRVNPSHPYTPSGLNNFVGDDTPSVIRLTRVFDTWSTDYTNAPDVDINLNGLPQNNTNVNPNNISWPANPPSNLPIYPSYPAPYTSPLRGIQIQIRVGDPRGEHIKVLTIRHDFTDKL